MNIKPKDYTVYLYHMGGGDHQLFIKNVSADADFIRIFIGYVRMNRKDPVGRILNQWILTPLRPENEHVHLGDFSRRDFKSKRLWVAFEVVRRGKKNETVGVLAALSPSASKWPTRIGALTYFDVIEENAASKPRPIAHWLKAIQ